MPITNTMGTPPPASASKRTVSAPRKPIKAQREEALNGMGQIAQIPLVTMRMYADVGAMSIHWPNIAKELANLAETQEPIAAVIDPLIKIGPYTALIAAVMPLTMQVLVNHKMAPAGAMGTVPASSLQAQVEAGLAQQELAALQVQLEAEQQAAQMRKEIDASRRAMADAMQDYAHEAADVK
jgi:hypothetical protein